MVDSRIRFEYVIKNFLLVCDTNTNRLEEQISYGKPEGRIIIPVHGDIYFNSSSNKIPDYRWENYKEQNIPILFPSIAAPYCRIEEGKFVFNFDIISAIFYFLSGWQEKNCVERDYLNRFVFENSIQKKLDIINIPVVNYYYLMLKEAMAYAGVNSGNNKFNIFSQPLVWITHDIDVVGNLWKKELKHDLKQFSLLKLFKKCLKLEYFRLSNSFNLIGQIQKKYDFKSTFFYLSQRKTYKGIRNADYDISNKRIKKIIEEQINEGNQIGIHGSFTTSENSSNMENDIINLGYNLNINRYHYLMFDCIKTIDVLVSNNIKFDSTLGFNSIPGFRNSTAFPFFLFNHKKNNISTVIEIPLIIMDASLFLDHYLNIKNGETAFNYIKPLIDQIKITGGILTVNWHNDSFVNDDEKVKCFEKLIYYTKEVGFKFVLFPNSNF